jgi:hypothetical protein
VRRTPRKTHLLRRISSIPNPEYSGNPEFEKFGHISHFDFVFDFLRGLIIEPIDHGVMTGLTRFDDPMVFLLFAQTFRLARLRKSLTDWVIVRSCSSVG